MEAANLGAWMAPFADDALDDALAMLADGAGYDADPRRYSSGRARRARRAGRGRRESRRADVGVRDEPTSAFATHIAKYFTNSIREDGLLAIARSGVVYAPGGAGTEQEIFTDTAQNSLTLYKVRSPMVFFGREFFEREHPELVTAARRQADEFGWSELFTVCDEPDEVVAFIAAHDPDASGAPASSAADARARLTMAVADRPRARRRRAVPRGVRPHPRRVRGAGRVPRRSTPKRGRGRERGPVTPAGRGDRRGSTRATFRS